MCGICGVYSTVGPPDLAVVRAMTERLYHRGPDSSGIYRDERVALGHSRLAIIDTAGGAQPLAGEGDRVWVSFNGEIFNYLELRTRLAALGHEFKTQSDTEVIVHAFEQWGLGCFDRFNGQWAIALWDREVGRLVLARDRLGVRPLYVARVPGHITFASEVRALLADPLVPRGLDPGGLAETVTFWSPVAPQTAFVGIEQVPPGCCLIIDDTGSREHVYWSIAFPRRGEESREPLEKNAARLRELLIEAVRLRFLRSDVPVGAYLSGGIDSAITAAVIAQFTDVPLRTFSVTFTDEEFDESAYQAIMVRRLGTDHTSIRVAPGDIARVFPEVVRHAETPLLRSAPAPMFLLSGLVRDHGLKVVVTGEGADEVLAGYDIFREARLRAFLGRDPASQVRGRAVELLYPWLVRTPSAAPAFARQFFSQDFDPADPAQSHRPRWNATRTLVGLFTPEWRDQMQQDVGSRLISRMPLGSVGWAPLGRAQWVEMTTLLPGYILASQGDRMLMAHSVEGRFPFLDRDVVDFAGQLPSSHKLLGLDEKHILKSAFPDLVPEEILRRDKQPYRAPDASCFFGAEAPDWVADVVSRERVEAAGVFQPDVVAGLVAKASRARRPMGNTDNMRVMLAVSTQLLHEQLVQDIPTSRGRAATHQPETLIDLVPAP